MSFCGLQSSSQTNLGPFAQCIEHHHHQHRPTKLLDKSAEVRDLLQQLLKVDVGDLRGQTRDECLRLFGCLAAKGSLSSQRNRGHVSSCPLLSLVSLSHMQTPFVPNARNPKLPFPSFPHTHTHTNTHVHSPPRRKETGERERERDENEAKNSPS